LENFGHKPVPAIFQAPSLAAPTPKPQSSADYGFSIDLTDMTLAPQIFTLRDLYEEGKSIYRSAKDEKKSCERLHAALETIGLDVDVRDLRTPALDYLVEALRARGLSPKTINRFLYAVSGALRWALSRELIQAMPVIPRQTEGVGRIAFVTEEDQDRIIRWLGENGSEDVAFATKILLLSGFRISEFLGLKRGDVRDGWVQLHEGHTKNNEGRRVFVGDQAAPLSAAIAQGLPSYRRISRGLSLASAALRIEPKVTAHTLRHSCATVLTTKGVSLATVGKMLGHKSLTTTLKYSHTEDQALIAAAKLLGAK
jgi:integrase